MSKTEEILTEINKLNRDELDIIYQELVKKMDKLDKFRTAIEKVRGIGKGVWGMDAQEYINELRKDDR